jgi:hypothetical protein
LKRGREREYGRKESEIGKKKGHISSEYLSALSSGKIKINLFL